MKNCWVLAPRPGYWREPCGMVDAMAISIFRQVFRFGVVGLCGSFLNYIIFYFFLVVFGINYIIAGIIGFVAAIPPVFFLNRAWTFESNVNVLEKLPVYVATNLIALCCHSAVQWFSKNIFGVHEVYTQLFGIAVSAVVNFVLAKLFVFSK